MEQPAARHESATVRWLLAHIQRTYAVSPEYLWARTPDFGAFRHPGCGKWFAVLMKGLPREKLGLAGGGVCDVLNVKCDPNLRGSVLDGRHFFPAYHMNKAHWVSVILDDELPRDTLRVLLDLSYQSLNPKKARSTGKPEKQTPRGASQDEEMVVY